MAWTEKTGRERTFHYKATMSVKLPGPEKKRFPKHGMYPQRYRIETAWWWEHPGSGTVYKLTLAFFFAQGADYWAYRVLIGLQNPPHDGTNWAGEYYDETTEGAGVFGDRTLTYEVSIPVEEFITYTADDMNASRYFGETPRITGQYWEGVREQTMTIHAPEGRTLDLGIGVVGLRLGWRAYFNCFYCESEITPDPGTVYDILKLNRVLAWSEVWAGGIQYLFKDIKTPGLLAWAGTGFTFRSTGTTIYVNLFHTERGWSYHYNLAMFAGPDLWADAPYQFNLLGDGWDFANGVGYPGVVEMWLVVGAKYAYGGEGSSPDPPFSYSETFLSDSQGHFDILTVAMIRVSWASGGFPGYTWLFMDYRTPDEYVPLGGWLYQHKERRADFGVAIDDWAFDSFAIAHLDELAVEAMDNHLLWLGNIFTTLSDGVGGDAGSVKAVIAGGLGLFRRIYGSAQRVFQHFRHLRVRARADASATMRVKFTFDDRFHPTDTDYWGSRTTHYWDLDLTTDYQDFDLDLCIPHDRGPEDDMNGIDGSVTKIAFEQLEDGKSYWIADLSLVTLGTSPSKYHLRADWEGDTPVPPEPPQRSVFRLHDGKRSLDGRRSGNMADLIAHLQAEALHGGAGPFGVVVTDLAPASPGGYWENDVGGPDDWTSREIHERYHVAEDGALTVERCCRLDILYPYPGCGDFATHGSYGPIVLRFDKPLRAQTQGILAEVLSDEPAAGIVITVEEQDGSTVSDAGGHFETVSTRDEEVERTVTLEEAGVEWEYLPHSRRLTMMNSEAEVLGAGNSDLDVSRDSRVYQVWSDETTIKIRSKGGGGPDWRVYTVGPGDFPSFYVDDLTADDYVFLAFESAGNVPLWRSADSGDNWIVALALFTGCTRPHIRKDKAMDLCLAFAWKDVDDGSIVMRRSDDDWATFKEAEYAILTDVPEQTVSCSFAGDEEHGFLLSYVDAGGVVRLLRSVDNGLTWSAI